MKQVILYKSFRLFDFHVEDTSDNDSSDNESSDKDSSDNESSDKERKTHNNSHFRISMFGLNELGETVCLQVQDYAPFFYIKVAPGWGERERIGLLQQLRKLVGPYYAPCIKELKWERHRDLYGFSAGAPTAFGRIEFTNARAMNQVRNLWFHPKEPNADRREPKPFIYERVKLELFESNIPPLLRFFHLHDISPSGWVKVPIKQVKVPTTPMTTCKYEYICKRSHIKALSTKETVVPYHICSFDIEASSSHGDFPVAKKTYRKLAMQLVDVFPVLAFSNKDSCSKQNALLHKLLMSAFGLSKKQSEGIDRVFPKTPAQEKKLQEVCEGSFVVNQDAIQAKDKDISRFFAVPEEDNEGQEGQEDVEEDVEEGQEDVEKDVEEGQEDVEKDVEEGQEDVDKTLPVIVSKEGTTLGNYLLNNPSVDRDTKIQVVTAWLGKHLPPLHGDKVTYIGSTFLRYGAKDPYRAVCLVLMEASGPYGECAPVEGVEILACHSERDLLLAWTQLMQSADPDVVIGYNIFGFDYDFLFQRAQENGCEEAFLGLSRVVGHVAGKRGFQGGGLSLETKKIVIASGPFDMRFPCMVGRFQIDLYTYFRREFNLSSYKLDSVATEFICDKVERIAAWGDDKETRIYSRNLRGLHAGDYVHLEEVGYTSEVLRDGAKFAVLQVGKEEGGCTFFSVAGRLDDVAALLSAKKTVRWGLAKDDVSPQDIFRLAQGSPQDRAKVAKYCIQDCNIVHQLLLKIDVLTSFLEMARICNVPMSYLVFRGQGIKLTSCLAKFCRLRQTLMPDLTARPGASAASADYEGAIVLPPKCGLYLDDPVSCNDYSSLYPSIIISNNLSQDSKVWTKEYDLQGRLLRSDMHNAEFDGLPGGYRYFDVEFDNFVRVKGGKKRVVGKTVVRWAQFPDGRRGVIPDILETILKARKATRKQAEAETDDFMKNILDKRQLAYKVTANSIYGQCGSRTSTFYDKDIAASTTAVGRKMILLAKTMVERVYGDRTVDHPTHGVVHTAAEYVYGDTDSVFMTFHLTRCDPVTRIDTGEKIRGDAAMELTVEFSKEVARLVTENLERPMELSYEKTFKVMALLSKKRYAGLMCEEDIHKLKLKFMGLSLKRRDNCDYLKDVYGGVLDCFLLDKGQDTGQDKVQRAIAFLRQALEDLLQGRVCMDKLTITKALRDYYKNPQQIAHAVLAARIGERDPGNRPRPGDRIRYVFVETAIGAGKMVGTGKLLQGDCIETPEFVLATGRKLNYHYYVTNQIMKPLLQLLGLAVEDILQGVGRRGEWGRFRADVAKMRADCGEDLELFAKMREKAAARIVQDVLFHPVLNALENGKKGQRSLKDMFMSASQAK